MSGNQPKIVSLVPSWTETLISAGVHVVGRTRFCIHPEQLVKSIPIVGGTKSLQLSKIQTLAPDFVLVDKQENTLEMANELIAAGFQLLISDVTDFKSLMSSLHEFSQTLSNVELQDFVNRYQYILENPGQIDSARFFEELAMTGTWPAEIKNNLAYVIWKNPFMVVGDSTFIAANFHLVGQRFDVSEKYPVVTDEELKQKFCLFSSEPFPFEKSFDQLKQQGFEGIIVDGEKVSWFGIRNLLFLEACLK